MAIIFETLEDIISHTFTDLHSSEIYIEKFPPATTENALKKAFLQFGEIISVKILIIQVQPSEIPKLFGYITF